MNHDDLLIDVYYSGQQRAVRVIHEPTGLTITKEGAAVNALKALAIQEIRNQLETTNG